MVCLLFQLDKPFFIPPKYFPVITRNRKINLFPLTHLIHLQLLKFQSETLGVKVNNPASFLKCSDSNTLKSGLYNSSHVDKNSRVFLFRSQLRIISAALELSFFAFAISVIQIRHSPYYLLPK